MSVYVRPFKRADLAAFVPIEEGIDRFDPELAQAIEDSGLAVTGIRNGEIVGCGGVHPLNDEQGEIWLRLSKDCLKHRLDTFRWLRDGLKIIEETFGFRQLNVMIKCGFQQSIKLALSVGFVQTQNLTHEGQKWSIFSKRVEE